MHNPIEIYCGTNGQVQAEVRFNQKAGGLSQALAG